MYASITLRFLFALTLSSLWCSPSFAKGGGLTRENPYNPQHIESLPPEVRAAVIHQWRTTPKALHYFASYTENSQRIVLHFEHFYCNSGRIFCNPSGCLHQIYVSSRGHYRLLRSYYSPAED
jgi:hypothetical protein